MSGVSLEAPQASQYLQERTPGWSQWLEQQVEAEELSNSVLLEISKSSVVSWREKLKTKYGWFKTDNCKNIIFEVRDTRLLTTDGSDGWSGHSHERQIHFSNSSRVS